MVVSEGKAVAVTWKKKNQKSQIELATADGKAVELTPGNTWIELMPNTNKWTTK